jgi:hypothetical protein
MTEPSTELVVLHPRTGELLAIQTAETEQLAEWRTSVDEARDALAEAEAMVNDELIRRLDRRAEWTLRVGDPKDRQWEIKAPSPTAGTETYPPDLLRAELNNLVELDVISVEAAQGALKRQLLLTLSVPWDAELQVLVTELKGAMGIRIGGVEVDAISADASERPVASGIDKLRKVPGASEALDRAKVEQPAGRRRAAVKLKTRETG